MVLPAVRKATRVLADPTFDTCAAVDVLLGADVMFTVVTGQVIPLGFGLPTVVRTKFGFVTMGSDPTSLCCSFLSSPLTLITPDALCAYQHHARYHQVPVATCFGLTASLIPLQNDSSALCKRLWEVEKLWLFQLQDIWSSNYI